MAGRGRLRPLGLAKPFLYFADAWGWVLGVRFSDRMGKGIRTAPRDALVADSIDEKRRGLAFGIHRAGDTAGAFVGLGLAALIVWLTESGAAQLTRHTFQIVVLASIIPALLAVLVLALGAADVSPGNRKPAPLRLTLEGMDARFKLFLFVVVLFTLGNSSDSFVVLLGQNRGLSVLQIMLMVMTFNLVYASLAGPLGSLSDRIGRRKLIIGGWIAYGLVYLGLAFSHAGWQVWVLYAAYGIYYGATDGVLRALVADIVPQERHGAAYGLLNAASWDHGLAGLRHRRLAVAGRRRMDRLRSFCAFLLWRSPCTDSREFCFGNSYDEIVLRQLSRLEDDQRGLFERSGAGSLASRYKA